MRLVILLGISIFIGTRIGLFAQQVPFKIVGYYSLQAAMSDPDTRSFKYLTHINLWFFNPDSTGHFDRDLSLLKPFIDKAHKKNIRVLISMGGGSKQAQYHLLLQDDHRAGFIQNIVAETIKYNLDGVDVDLEGSDIDDNYEKFVLGLAAALRSHQKLITAAVAVYYKNQLSDLALSTYDFVNIMSYDRTGPWNPKQPGPHARFTHAVEDLRYFGAERKLDKSRMTLGVPFYGYGFGSSSDSKPISKSYKQIIQEYPEAAWVDEWLMPDGKILYYNGIPTIIQKTRMAADMASGIMIWQVLGDAPGKKSLLRAIRQALR